MPRGHGVVAGRSRCDGCGRVPAARDLVPILSFIAPRGCARCCNAAIPGRLPAIEGAFLLVPATAALAGAPLPASCVLGRTLAALAVIDLHTLTSPDGLTLPLLAGVLASGADARTPVAFGPAVAAGIWTAWLFGPIDLPV